MRDLTDLEEGKIFGKPTTVNPLAFKYTERDNSLVPNFPSQVTNYQVDMSQSEHSL